ncbi:MAG: tRNA epoxyqueuosine(34) reductase QueG [Acidimicrobiales bacterium]|nr:tRNA epoxyqueuosine(34) reductase QueG [Acidimicrobiales bacterium]
MSQPLRYLDLVGVGTGAGLDVVGACTAEPFTRARAVLEERKAAGLNGTMQFTYRNPARSTEAERVLPGAASFLVGACSYHRDPPPVPEGVGPVARVGRYVWADDQERLLRGLEAIAERLTEAGFRAVALSDQNHLVDRAVAHRAGLGWYGKNANILMPGHGSWFVLGAVLTDAAAEDIEGFPTADPMEDGCGTCVRCIDACPTDAIVAPGVVDARRCLSWSLQVRGPFPVEHRVLLGDRIYGCDDCQDVCPPNRLEQRRAGRGGDVAVPEGDPARAWVHVLDLLATPDDVLLERHGRWYIPDRDPAYLRRNALVVLGNVGDGRDPAVRDALEGALRSRSGLVRSHAVWAARRLGCDDLLATVAGDTDPDVRLELERRVPPIESPT